MRGVLAHINSVRTLVVADTHVGYEAELWQKGIRAASQTRSLVNKLISWAESVKARQLAIVGDVKHEIPNARSTLSEVRGFLGELSEHFDEVILVPGNHDTMMERILEKLNAPNVVLSESRGLLVEFDKRNVLLTHGHVKPRLEHLVKADVVIMGHTHPAVALRDLLGYTVREPAILRIRADLAGIARRMYDVEVESRELTVVILPAAHPLITGVDVRNILKVDSSKTILAYIDVDPAKVEVYLPGFTYLGTLEEYSTLTTESAWPTSRP